MIIHRRSWFLARIGKRIYRLNGPGKECCLICAHAKTSGIVVMDERSEASENIHAKFLFDVQDELGYRYADKPRRIP